MNDLYDDLAQTLNDLLAEHADLNRLIDEIEKSPNIDQVTLQRFKKHKLLLKDKIEVIKSRMHPDVIA